MVSPCLSAGGLRFLGHLVPAAGLGRPSEDRPAYWPGGPDRNGVTTFRTSRDAAGGPPMLRGLGVPACRRWYAFTRPRARSGSRPSHRRVSHRLRRPFVTQPQRRFIRIHPSRLSLTRFTWMVQARLGLHPSALARHVTGALARVGNRPGHKSGPVLTHHRPLIWSDFVSHALYAMMAAFRAISRSGVE